MLSGIATVIFGKQRTEDLKEELNDDAGPISPDARPAEESASEKQLDAMADDLAHTPALTSADLTRTSAPTPSSHVTQNLTPGAGSSLTDLLTSIPGVPFVLNALDTLLKAVSAVEDRLFTLPVVNLLSPLFYKICAESATMTLSCSVSVPVGVPVPADVTGDHLPDVLAQLSPLTNVIDVGAKFAVTRLDFSHDLPAHVFAVYDTPVVKKRITVGIDGRASTLGRQNRVQVMLKNVAKAIKGDVRVAASVTTTHPGSTQALTFGVKDLVGGSAGHPATEQDPLTGSVQMAPWPETLEVGAHLTHNGSTSTDSLTLHTPTPTRVDAAIDQAITSEPVQTQRHFTATIDQLPSDVQVDLTSQGKHQHVTYAADDEIDLVAVTDTITPDISKPTEVDHAVYQVHGVPQQMQVDLDGDTIDYRASDTIDKVSAAVERRGGDRILAEVLDIPDRATVVFDGKNAQLDWDASAPITSATASAHLTAATLDMDRDFDAGLQIDRIPAIWHASWADGDVVFDAPLGGIGAITANVTNHDDVHTLPGDHLSAYYDEPSGDLDASLRISDLRRASFTKVPDTGDGGGFQADLNMGDHGAFDFAGEVHADAGDLIATGSLSDLPSAMSLRSAGGRITYTGDTHPDAVISVAAGKAAALDATPTPPQVHGVSIRDGADGDDVAVRAEVYLTGLPTGLDLDTTAGVYSLTGYHPSIDTLVVDAVLDALAPEPLSLRLEQGVPTATPVDMTFGPITTDTLPDGTHTIGLDYHASQPLGALTANATYGHSDEAQLDISAIPASISVDAAFGADTKTIGVDMSQGIEEISAAYKHVGDATFAATARLGDVPKTVDITIGKESSDDGSTVVDAPAFTMTSSAPGLDLDVHASARIAEPLDVDAALDLSATDIGSTVTGDLIGSRLHVTSAPATQSFVLQASGQIQKSLSLDFGDGGFRNRGDLGIDLQIHQVTLGLTDFSDVNIRLGFTTGVDGQYGQFTFGQQTDLTIDIEDTFSVHIDWPDPLGSSDIDLVTIPHKVMHLGNVVPRWHLNKNVFGEIFHIPVLEFGIANCGATFDALPAPGSTTSSSTFTVGQPPSESGYTPAWLITPDIDLLGFSLPDFALDIIAFFLSPYDHKIHVHPECEWGPGF